ncbi:MAG: radical SAM protein [Deltaproteobacteria bacterium]
MPETPEMTTPPFLVSWNLTKRCNLRCVHCYLGAVELEGASDIDTRSALRIVDEIASINPSAMVIMTGGEPLLRPDLPEIASYASSKGLSVVVGTNGTLLTPSAIESLIKANVAGVGVSLDSAAPEVHDRFRGVPGAWLSTIKGIDNLKESGLPFQLHLTVTKENRGSLKDVIRLAGEKGATGVNIFFLVCTGRGQQMTDLSPSEYEGVLEEIAKADDTAGGVMVRARCAPHIVRVAGRINPDGSLARGGTSGCIAATGYMRITPEGRVTPCPYIPPSPEGPAIGEKSLKDIWEKDPLFTAMRKRDLEGRCGGCEFKETCGGCRARAFASGNSLSGEDPWCVYTPSKNASEKITGTFVRWTAEAQERLDKAPSFLRSMIKKGVEAYARSKGLNEITPEVMATLRKRAGR